MLLCASAAVAQELPLKASLEPNDVVLCGVVPSGPSEVSAGDASVDSLLMAGSRAAILGDHDTAGELLRQAATLAPNNSVIAYRLARTYEDQGEPELAVREYCRYLLIAPEAPDAAEVQQRIRTLASSASLVDQKQLADDIQAGLDSYALQQYEAAVLAFSRAVEMRPDWAPVYYNRGVANLALRRPADAVADLERYLELLPSAEDRSLVQARIDSVRAADLRSRTLPAPGGVFARGLVLPGLGQLSTGRPLSGILVLGASSAAVFWALQEEQVTRKRTGVDPFGNPYEFEVQVGERTHFVTGIGAAVGIAMIGAIEAFVVARSRLDAVQRISSVARRDLSASLRTHRTVSGNGVALELRLSTPSRHRAGDGRWSAPPAH